MRNLRNANAEAEVIKRELTEAKVTMSESDLDIRLYCISGKIGQWNLIRLETCWVAKPQRGYNGLPLHIAICMHEKDYPKEKYDGCVIEKYGTVIRANGNNSNMHPNKIAMPCELDMINYDLYQKDNVLEYLKEKNIVLQRYIDMYHIDTQEGLNEFVRTIISLSKEEQVKPVYNLFYSKKENILFWITTEDDETQSAKNIIASLQSKLFEFINKGKLNPESHIYTKLIKSHNGWNGLRVFFAKGISDIPEETYVLNEEWNMEDWLKD